MLDVDNLQDLRDITIVAFTIAGTVLFLVATLAAFLGVIAFAMAIRTVNGIRSRLYPTIESLQEAVADLRGSATFISEHAVQPVIRVYSIYAGVRRFLAVMARLRRLGARG